MTFWFSETLNLLTFPLLLKTPFFQRSNITLYSPLITVCVCVCVCVCIMHTNSLQSCSTLWDPMDCNPPGSSDCRILQTRILEWVAIPSSRGSSWPRDQTCVSYVSCVGSWVLYHYCHLGRPVYIYIYLFGCAGSWSQFEGSFSCSKWQVGSSSLTSDWAQGPCIFSAES